MSVSLHALVNMTTLLCFRILEMEQGVIESKSLPNEMLYGRAGYIYTLLMLQYEIGEAAINKNTILNVSLTDLIIVTSLSLSLSLSQAIICQILIHCLVI